MATPNANHSSEPNWIVVAVTSGPVEAAMIAERLQSLGIPAIIQHEPLGAILGLSIGPLSQARVAVPETFFERAIETLEPGATLLEDGEIDDIDDDDEWDDDWDDDERDSD
ncbi:MAG: DUF2007 domain-containing protein [Chloroflexota bacterium]